MDDKGSAMIEITIALIAIVLIFGIIVNTTELTTQKVIKSEQTENIEELLSEFIDNLINNPRDYNWQEYKTIPGLAILNEEGQIIPNSVSYAKFVALGEDYKEMVDEKIFKQKIKTSIELVPRESSISSVKIGHNMDNNDIYSVNRLVKCDFYKKYVMKDFTGEGKCNHNHDNSSHSCNYFKIFKGNLRKSDYYILTDPNENAEYFIDTTQDKGPDSWQSAGKSPIYLNDKINFFNDTSEVVFIHFNKKSAKAILISVPKGFDKGRLNYDYFRINDCELILKACLN